MLAPGSILLNRYRVVRLIGRGGMGAVYEAVDQTFDSTVAVKQTLVADDYLRKAFEREAKLLNRLRHRALPVVMNYFFEDDGEFLVMQYIPGEDLGGMMKRRTATIYPQGVPKPFDIGEVLDWADQLLDALDYLHGQSPPVIHRDIKPQNLKLNERGDVILLDFGLAKGLATATLTAGFSSVAGYTPSYAPLEQIHGSGTSPQSDLYALAATLYHLLTATTPVNALTRATATISGKPDPLVQADRLNRQIPAGVSELLMRALSQNPEQRPHSAAIMRRALRDAAQETETETSGRRVEKEKLSRGDRIVVQLAPDTVVEARGDKQGEDEGAKSRRGKNSAGKQTQPTGGEGSDTEATVVRPTRKKPPATEPRTAPPKTTEQGKKTTPPEQPTPTLNRRQRRVLELLGEGCTDDMIADTLSLGTADVASTINDLKVEAQVWNRKELIAWAVAKGVIKQKVSGTESRPKPRKPAGSTDKRAKSSHSLRQDFFDQMFGKPQPPPVTPPIVDESNLRRSPPGPDAGKPKQENPKDTDKPKEGKSKDTPLANLLYLVGFGGLSVGAVMALYNIAEKSGTRTMGEIVGMLVLGALALLFGIGALGALVELFESMKKK